MSDIFKVGFKYKKFKVLKVFDVSDYHSKAVYLRHEKTGLEIVHFFNDDSENLFAFAFRTPNPKSNGAAHIIEHSVLCGSEKFPLKDPFVTMSNQSVKTYLNAMTYPDKTIYPASSIAKEDYFNLMDVYGDAVFFPKLQKEIFMQEAHRLEADKNGKISMQGVVYNEMKGNYSSFDSVANDAIALSLLKNSVYEKDSGGDPLEIPSITYEEFKNFHKKWYRADNCLVFLYGNIPTTEQLDFLQEKILDRIENRNSDFVLSEENQKKNLDEFLNFVKSDKSNSPVYEEFDGPVSESGSGSTVLVSWNLGNAENCYESAENVVAAGILANHDGSPFQKSLVESNLGEDIAPQSGFSNSFYDKIFTIGLRGVKKSNAKKVEKVVLETLVKIVKNGISKKDIETTLMGLEISQREIKRAGGPFSLALMTRLAGGWAYGYDVSEQIRSRKVLDEIKNKIEKSDDYLVNLIKNKFLDNKNRSLAIITPSKKYSENREKAEQKIISEILKTTAIEEIKSENEQLHAFQHSCDDESCLPHLHPADFIKNGHPLMNKGDLTFEEVKLSKSSAAKKIPFLVSNENTNGMIYFDLAFPVDLLSAQDYGILPLLSGCVTECGWKNLNWAQTAEETALCSGGIGTHLLTMDSPETELSKKFCGQKNWTKRDWIIFSTFMIEEKCEDALNLLSDCVSGVDFSDLKRIRDIVNEAKNDFESSIVPDGHIYVSSRVCSLNSQKSAVDEIWNGITQLGIVRKAAEKSDEELSKIFKNLYEKIRKSGALIHVTAEKSALEKIKKILPDFIEKTALCEIQPPRKNTLEDFEKVINCEFESDSCEIFKTETQVGFAAFSIPAAAYGTKDCACDEVCAHWLSNNLLWEKIRTVGGAYGSFCTPENFGKLLIFATYRDPNPLGSCAVFEKCIEECAEIDFDAEDVEKTVMGCYSHFIQPQTPKGRGAASFTRALYGILDSDREQKIKWLLEINQEDVKKTFKRLYKQMKNPEYSDKIREAVLCGKKSIKNVEKAQRLKGKIHQLSL